VKVNELKFVKKLQNQPEHIKKVILWTTIIVIGLGLIFWWIINVEKSIKEFQKEKLIEGLNLPRLEEEIKDFPSIEIPKLDEEELKKLEEQIKKLGEEDEEGQNSGPNNQQLQ